MDIRLQLAGNYSFPQLSSTISNCLRIFNERGRSPRVQCAFCLHRGGLDVQSIILARRLEEKVQH